MGKTVSGNNAMFDEADCREFAIYSPFVCSYGRQLISPRLRCGTKLFHMEDRRFLTCKNQQNIQNPISCNPERDATNILNNEVVRSTERCHCFIHA